MFICVRYIIFRFYQLFQFALFAETENSADPDQMLIVLILLRLQCQVVLSCCEAARLRLSHTLYNFIAYNNLYKTLLLIKA